uniref:Candidate secreted effector n=1 Tax=Meloidogyne incognita TaxID=6306 RepID=A0A914KK41_MELIC
MCLLLIYYARKIEGGNVGEDEGDGSKIKGSKSELEGRKGGELGGIGGEIESGKEGQVKGGEGGKGGEFEQEIKSDIERGEEDKIEVKGGERVPEQFVKKSDKETKSLKKVWGKIENKTEAIKDEIKYENDFPSLIDSRNVTKKTMKYKYLSAKKGEKSLKIT